MTRTGDRATPTLTPHPIPPNVPMGRWPAQLRVALERLPTSAHTWDDDDPAVIWDGGVPDVPTAVIGSPGPGVVGLSWTAPTFDGGSPILDYVVQYAINPPGTWTTFPDTVSTTTAVNVTGLTNGTAYVFRVAAVNTDGQGDWSAVSSPVTPTSGALILVDPCNNFTDAPWTVAGTVTVNAGGHTGNGFLVAANAANTITFSVPTAQQADRLTFGAWCKWSGLSGATQPYFRWLSDSGATQHMELRIDNGGFTEMRRSGPTQTIGNITGGSGIVANTWFYVEAYIRLGNTPNGEFTVRVNGTPVNTWAGDDTSNSAGIKTVWDTFRIIGSSSGTLLVDDIYLRNDGNWGPT